MIDIHVRFWRPAFHGRRDSGEADWPPSPARLIGALLAGAYSLADDDERRATALEAIQFLTLHEPPTITAPESIELTLPATFTESTWKPSRLIESKAERYLDLSHLGFNSASRVEKTQGGTVLADTLLSYRINASLDDAALAALRSAASRVAYFGTSKDPADITVEPASEPLAPVTGRVHRRWNARPRANGASRGWQHNTVEWFDLNFERVFGTDPAITRLAPAAAHAYTRPLHYTAVGPAGREEFAILPLVRSVPHHAIAQHLGGLNAALRDARQPWLAIPLTVSNFAHADGRLVGVGLLPRQPEQADEVSPASNEEALLIAEHALVTIEQHAAARYPRRTRAVGPSGALQARTWIGPSASWYSVTPLRAFPHEHIARVRLDEELRARFGVGIDALSITREPAASFSSKWSDRPYTDGFGQWWASFTVDTPIEGPLLLGSANDDGFGLFHPGDSA